MELRNNSNIILNLKKPLIFQITDWYSYDEDFDENNESPIITDVNKLNKQDDDDDDVYNEDSDEKDSSNEKESTDEKELNVKDKTDNKRYFIRIFGVDQLAQSVSVK